MKLLLLGDTHITDRKPARRKDQDYFGTILGKLNQAEQIADTYGCDIILQSGDWFDSWRVGSNVVSELIKFLRFYNKRTWYCIYGQHDIYGHSAESFSYSSLRILQEAGVVSILGRKGTEIIDYGADNGHQDKIYFYGASFGQDIPKVVDPKAYNVLVIHEMIGDVPLYSDQELVHPASFLRSHPQFNLVLAGDYHYRFCCRFGGRVCINTGALVRKTISENDLKLKPAVVIFDTETSNCEVVELQVVPTNEIFDFEVKIEKEDPNYQRLLEFLENMKKSTSIAAGWKRILDGLISQDKPPVRVIDLLDDCIKQVEGVK